MTLDIVGGPGRSVDFAECPNYDAISRWRCHCRPACAVCGAAKHTGIHGPKNGAAAGTPPWGHEYAPEAGGDE